MMRCWRSCTLVMMKMMLNVSFVSFFLFSDFFMPLESEKDDFQKRENRNLLQLSPSFLLVYLFSFSLFILNYFNHLLTLLEKMNPDHCNIFHYTHILHCECNKELSVSSSLSLGTVDVKSSEYVVVMAVLNVCISATKCLMAKEKLISSLFSLSQGHIYFYICFFMKNECTENFLTFTPSH